MPRIMIRSLIALICCLPAFASAATTHTIQAEWSKYTPPSGYTVAGYRLYQEGQLACQTSASTATSLGCQVSMNTSKASFTLTAAFTNGTESLHSTPFAFTAPTVPPSTPQANVPPTAAFSVSVTSGTAPLNITFNASASSDSDGTIAYYAWSFGDGTSATGKYTSRTYSTAGTFTATLTVTDNQGASSTTSRTINVQSGAQAQTPSLRIEAGEIAVSSSWVRVYFDAAFTNPIVVAGPPQFANSDPCVVRIRNVTRTGFDIQLAEWNYQDRIHPQETVNYLVLEKGSTTLPDGSIVEAGSFTGTTSFNTVRFSGAFAKTPVVLTTVASVNESDTISGRVKDIGLTGFAYYFREQEKNRNIHANETINYIAWEPGKGTIGTLQFEAATTGQRVTNYWYRRTFQSAFSQAPVVLADMQSTNDTDTAALRMYRTTSTDFIVKVEEEQSLDTEVTHGAETVGYLAINPTDK